MLEPIRRDESLKFELLTHEPPSRSKVSSYNSYRRWNEAPTAPVIYQKLRGIERPVPLS